MEKIITNCLGDKNEQVLLNYSCSQSATPIFTRRRVTNLRVTKRRGDRNPAHCGQTCGHHAGGPQGLLPVQAPAEGGGLSPGGGLGCKWGGEEGEGGCAGQATVR